MCCRGETIGVLPRPEVLNWSTQGVITDRLLQTFDALALLPHRSQKLFECNTRVIRGRSLRCLHLEMREASRVITVLALVG
jgi:hypothetical protein